MFEVFAQRSVRPEPVEGHSSKFPNEAAVLRASPSVSLHASTGSARTGFFVCILLGTVALISQLSAAQENGVRPWILTGEVQASGAVPIVMPPSNSSPTLIRYFVAEGQTVKIGDPVLRIDAGALGSISDLQAQIDLTQARVDKELADLRVAAVNAELAELDATAASARAKLDAAVPKIHLSPLDFDRFAAEAARSAQDLAQKSKVLSSDRAAVVRKAEDAQLELNKAKLELAFALAGIERSEVRATVNGMVTHGFSEWRGGGGRRYDEGENAQSGAVVGQVLNGDRTFVRAYALEADRLYLTEKQRVSLSVDALPNLVISADIRSISNTPEARAAWGDGRYFRVDIELPPEYQARLAPGMSVRVTDLALTVQAKLLAQKSTAALEIEGELAAGRTSIIAPPTVKDLWQLTLQTLVPEGTMVGPEQAIAVFDGQTLVRQVEENKGRLDEVARALDKLDLDQAQAERTDALAQTLLISEAEKAARKAAQPEALVGGIAYKKLLIDKATAREKQNLSALLLQAQRGARAAELRDLQLQKLQLEGKIAELNTALAKMSVKPTLTGMVIHNVGFNGDKFTSGSQIFMGQSVAQVADLTSLRVNAWVPEALSSQIEVGMPAQVLLGSGARTLRGRVSRLGLAFRSRSRAQPVIVRDVTVELTDLAQFGAEQQKTLKPGTAVRVSLMAGAQ